MEVRVRVACGDDWSTWGPVATVEAGLLEPTDWVASLISPATVGGIGGPAPVLRGTIDVPGEVHKARLYATAHGVYLPSVNGHRIDDTVLAPGWTAYEHRLRYHTYDVTDLVVEGQNEVEVLLGNGWYRGYLGYLGERALYGDRLGLLAQLEVTTADGAVHVLDIRRVVDRTRERDPGRRPVQRPDDRPPVARGAPTHVRRGGAPDRLRAPGSARRSSDPAHGVAACPAGVDLAVRTYAGRLRPERGRLGHGCASAGCLPGTEVVIRHAEVLERRRARHAAAARGEGRPTPTSLAGGERGPRAIASRFHGFRYAEVSGVPGLRARRPRAASSSGPTWNARDGSAAPTRLLNRLHENVVWGDAGQLHRPAHRLPTARRAAGLDRRHRRSSRPTALFLYRHRGPADLVAGGPGRRTARGRRRCPTSCPTSTGPGHPTCRRRLGRRRRDRAVDHLPAHWRRRRPARQLPTCARGWTGWPRSPGRIASGPAASSSGTGWIPTAPPENPGDAKADPDVVATAHLARSASLVADAASVLSEHEVAATYAHTRRRGAACLRPHVRHCRRVASSPTPRPRTPSPCSGTCSPSRIERVAAGQRLADLVRAAGFRISTGFVGHALALRRSDRHRTPGRRPTPAARRPSAPRGSTR